MKTAKIPKDVRYVAYSKPVFCAFFLLSAGRAFYTPGTYEIGFSCYALFVCLLGHYLYRLWRENWLKVEYTLSGPWLVKKAGRKEQCVDVRTIKILMYNTSIHKDPANETFLKVLRVCTAFLVSVFLLLECRAYLFTSDGEKMTFPSDLMIPGTDTQYFISPIFSSIDKKLLPEDFQMISRYPG